MAEQKRNPRPPRGIKPVKAKAGSVAQTPPGEAPPPEPPVEPVTPENAAAILKALAKDLALAAKCNQRVNGLAFEAVVMPAASTRWFAGRLAEIAQVLARSDGLNQELRDLCKRYSAMNPAT